MVFPSEHRLSSYGYFSLFSQIVSRTLGEFQPWEYKQNRELIEFCNLLQVFLGKDDMTMIHAPSFGTILKNLPSNPKITLRVTK